MSYKALYRKYRPSSFDEVYGQQHIVATLKNAVENDRLAHAYLFCGPRGTGKTSTAKLLAKTVNCTGEHKPCGKCENCIDIQNSSHPDVIELDGATNNGVDEIRELVDRVKYAPMQGKYKIYIIDEVHMITANAFNALLKTLEEPPEYCIFILCTTEPHKVLPTIVSRCQRFDFNKIGINVIQGRIKEICTKENITISDQAVRVIAELADGGLRDALSILDQCIAYSPEKIEENDVLTVYGIATTKEKMDLFKTIKSRDVDTLISMVNSLSNRGTDLRRLTVDLINMAKEAVIYSYSGNKSLLEKIDEKQARELLDELDSGKLLNCIDCLMDINAKYAGAVDSLSYFEVGFLKMMEDSTAAKIVFEAPETVDKIQKNEHPKPARKEKNLKTLTDDEFLAILRRATKEQKQKDEPFWSRLLANMDDKYGSVVMPLQGARIMADSLEDLIITVDEKIVADSINEKEQLSLLEELVEKEYGAHRNVICITTDKQNQLVQYFRDNANKVIAEPENKEQPGDESLEVTARLTKLFGAEGFDETED